MTVSLLIVETHPIQYRAPIYARLNELMPGHIHVVYASDFSVRGGLDPGFSQSVAWDSDLLKGYPFTVLDPTLDHPPRGWLDLKGQGLPNLINRLQPKAILLNSLTYIYDYTAYATALLSQIPVWMRCETQDQAFSRPLFKTLARSGFYRLVYSGIRLAFPIGELSRQHWISHGLQARQLRYARYCTLDRSVGLSINQKEARRLGLRHRLGIQPRQFLVAFFGKLISKKDPSLLLEAVPCLSQDLRKRLSLLFVGSGEMKHDLEMHASTVYDGFGVESHFPGFVNQSALLDWYLAADIVVLPSRRAGETWGLVVNEALQAGCSVVTTEAVGCAADFCKLQRFRVIPVGSAQHLAQALTELADFKRSFDWASETLHLYSVEESARSIASAMTEFVSL